MRHTIKAFSLSLMLLIVAVGAGSENTSSGTAGADRPNIIVILTDDLDAQSIAFMPKLKALLSDQGVSFSNFFVSFSLCCPSRATILRGQYAHNTQILGNRPPDGSFEKFHALGEENSTIATWLQAAGYRTMYVGKYLNGYPQGVALTYVPPGWDEWYSAVKGNPYSEYNYTLNENGKLVSYGNRPEDYGTDVYARKSVDFIQRMAKEGKPFFIHLAVYAPHGPATPAPRHAHLFPDAKAPHCTPNFNEEDVSDKPAYIRNRPLLTSEEIAPIDEQHRKRLQSLQAVDDAIASLIDTLKATEQLDRTYIFFTSDNGFHLGNHRLATGKVAPYEEDIRVPLIVRGPGVPAGRTIEHLSGNVDLAPTWAELAGAKAPDFVDGRSLVPLLGNNPPSTDSWRQVFLLENGNLDRQAQGLGIPPYRGLRTKDYLYVEYNTGERELYDLNKDPYELQTLSATADPALLEQLSSRLAELRHCVAAGCRAAEDVPLAAAHAPTTSPMTLLKVADAVARHALCNDGTPAAYYFRRGQGMGSHRWVIHLQGGGMCYSLETCQTRSVSTPRLMTSEGLPSTRMGSGVQSPLPTENPDFFNAHHIYVHYCSSDLWSGDREAAPESGGWHFRGARIVRAVIEDLMNPLITPSPNLADATEVLFSGGSAGGAGVMANLDWVASQLPRATVRGLNDAGWAVDMRPYKSSIAPFLIQTQQGYAFWNGVVDASCAAANPGAEGRCYMAYAYPYISTPLFVQQAQFDGAILRLLGVTPPFDEQERAYMLEFAAAVRQSLESVQAAFSPATTTHSIVVHEQFWSLRIAGYSLRDVLGNWFFARPGPIKLIEQSKER